MIDGLQTWWLMPLVAGLLLAVSAGPLGSFVVWRRMAFFGDTLAHGALLGITFGVLTDLDPTLALVVGSASLALILLPLQLASRLSADTLLGIVSHGTLAIGLVALSLADGIRVDPAEETHVDLTRARLCGACLSRCFVTGGLAHNIPLPLWIRVVRLGRLLAGQRAAQETAEYRPTKRLQMHLHGSGLHTFLSRIMRVGRPCTRSGALPDVPLIAAYSRSWGKNTW